MAKATSQELKNRMRDETRGIRPGATREPDNWGAKPDDDAPLPEISELGLDRKTRAMIELNIAAHVEANRTIKAATETKDGASALLKSMIGNLDTRSFYCLSNRVTMFKSGRDSFDKGKAMRLLIEAGLDMDTVNDIFKEATTKTYSDVLKITPPREE